MDDILFETLINDNNLYTIDLHRSKNVTDALEQLEKELFAIKNRKISYCRVVYGLGEGILRRAVWPYLQKHPLVSSFREGVSGGDCIVVLD